MAAAFSAAAVAWSARSFMERLIGEPDLDSIIAFPVIHLLFSLELSAFSILSFLASCTITVWLS